MKIEIFNFREGKDEVNQQFICFLLLHEQSEQVGSHKKTRDNTISRDTDENMYFFCLYASFNLLTYNRIFFWCKEIHTRFLTS